MRDGLARWMQLLLAGVLVACLVPFAAAEEEEDAAGSLSLVHELVPVVEEIRGWSFKHPVDMKLYSEEELREYVLAQLDREYPEERIRNTERFLHMVGVIPDTVRLKETMIEVLVTQIGGFYDPTTRAFYMIEREEIQYGPVVDRVMIAHELTHALDDQYVNLDSLLFARTRTEDGEFVLSSVVEGSATALMTTYVMQLQVGGELEQDDLTDIMASEEERSRVFLEAPPYFQTLIATYSLGMLFLLEGNMGAIMAGGEKVGKKFLAAISDFPQSSEQILHPEKYWGEERDPPVVVDDASVTALLEAQGWSTLGMNTAGEIYMGVVTTPSDRAFKAMAAATPAYWTNDASMGWGGDRFFVLEREGSEAGVWITAWDTPGDRDEFVGGYSTEVLDPERRWFPLGERGAVFLFDLDESTAESIEKAFTDSPPGFTWRDEAWTP